MCNRRPVDGAGGKQNSQYVCDQFWQLNWCREQNVDGGSKLANCGKRRPTSRCMCERASIRAGKWSGHRASGNDRRVAGISTDTARTGRKRRRSGSAAALISMRPRRAVVGFRVGAHYVQRVKKEKKKSRQSFSSFASFTASSGRTFDPIKLDSKDLWKSSWRAIDWCVWKWNYWQNEQSVFGWNWEAATDCLMQGGENERGSAVLLLLWRFVRVLDLRKRKRDDK